ncbi:MAG TPA: hypothetical protein VNU68_13310 [Verrucomicrobiae bacterium]|nr:hypothetical protein [Verrucomicrobiae bacterium]
MRLPSFLLALCVPCLPGLFWGATAGPLVREHVAADAKWLIHLDLDAFRETQLGGLVFRQFLDEQINKVTQGLKDQFEIDFDSKQIHGVTAYGLDFKQPEKMTGVVVIETDLDVVAGLDAILEKAGPDAHNAPFERLQQQPFPMYATKDGVVGGALAKGVFVLARKQEHLERARRVFTGQADSLSSAKSGPQTAAPAAGFLTISVLDAALAGAGLPPQVRVLKDAQGAQVVAAEKADKIFVSAELQTKDAEVATQIQQALQGAIALAKLSELPDQDLKQLAESAKVSGRENTVTLDLQVPIEMVSRKMIAKKRRG